ncbi:MAG TPA: TetR family transcriptional regulator [Thermomicrobiaceae bacterium]|nr:TetR family transcriptional regulator [Thermomicrobiaceae bacterium]
MVEPAGGRSPEDLTARARIRDAALRLFTERGIDGATIRDIAAAAGVSPGLVRHHFGSKEALRDACDAHALERLTRLQAEIFDEGRLADQGFLLSIQPTALLLQNYLVRSMMDGSDAAAAMFDTAVRIGERWLAGARVESSDPRAFAAVMVAMKLGVFLLHEQLSRVLGVDVRTPAGHARLLKGMVDATTYPLLTPEQAEQLRAAVDHLLASVTQSRRAG